MKDITELNYVSYKNAFIFINRKKNEMPYGILIQHFFNSRLFESQERWFLSISEAKEFINQNNHLYYYKG